jgi:hypothetical protein
LNSLAPLIKKDKYSEETLNLLFQKNHIDEKTGNVIRTKPWFKSSTINFLVQEEIIPDPHTQFGKAKSSYLPLKEKFLAGEQRIIRAKLEAEQEEFSGEQIKQKKLSILHSLMEFAQEQEGNLNINLTLDD